VSYTLEVPAGDTYRVVLDPYFEIEELAGADLAEDFDIGFERQEGDPAPDFHDRPSGPIPGTDLFRIAGTLEILAAADDRPSFLSIPLGGCVTTGGYEDIKVGAQITVRDQTGTILGIGELEPIFTDMFKCEFAFTIDVPDATCAPTTDPAEVPMTTSAVVRSTPSAVKPASKPISHAMPVIPPPPRTRAVPGILRRRSSSGRAAP